MEKKKIMAALVAMVCLLLCFGGRRVASDASDHRYKLGDRVPILAAKIAPYANAVETYRYYDLPFCSSGNVSEKKEVLGGVFNGERLVDAPYKLHFGMSHESKLVCKKLLSKQDLERFRSAISEDYFFQMYVDDLPIWGFVGQSRMERQSDPSKFKYSIYKSFHFEILYNNDRVIESSLLVDNNELVDITEDREVEIEFSYTANWRETNLPFDRRMDRYFRSSSMRRYLKVQWFSTINSCVLVLLLTGFLATIFMRVLKNDLVRYANNVEFADGEDETGWKNIHGDVFRFPENKTLLSAFLGCGTQLLVVAILFLIFALAGLILPYNHGASFTALIVVYAITSGIAGYTATSFFCQLEGVNWVRNLLLAGCMFSGPLFLIFCFLNSVAMVYGSTAELPFGTIVVILLIWILVACPLLVLGGIIARNRNTEFQAPCHTTKCPREIPQPSWYRRAIPQMAIAGFLPFGGIYIELYYVIASLWGHRVYTTYVILFLVFIILLIVTAFFTVALTYFQLAAEDHEWWLRSLLYGGSTALYVYGYCFYYYFVQTNMSGFMQTSFFFGYMACICYGLFLMLGTMGFYASSLFVRHIYQSIKCE